MANQAASLGHNAVHGVKQFCLFGPVIYRGGHGRLVGHGHRKPGQAQGPHGIQRLVGPTLGDL